MSDAPPGVVQEYAEQAIAYVQRSLKMTLEYDSETLPVLDHYLRSIPQDRTTTAATTELIVVTAGAYFGEVVRRLLGGRWELSEEPKLWRLVLPAGISFAPAGLAASAIVQSELGDLDTALDAPPRMKPYLEQALERMGGVSEDAYFSLSGRLDTIEHLHEVLVSVAAQLLGDAKDPDDEGEGDGDEDDEADAEKRASADRSHADEHSAGAGGAIGGKPGRADDSLN